MSDQLQEIINILKSYSEKIDKDKLTTFYIINIANFSVLLLLFVLLFYIIILWHRRGGNEIQTEILSQDVNVLTNCDSLSPEVHLL